MKRALVGAALLSLVACVTEDTQSPVFELHSGDMDPNAPPGWPLAIGDADVVPWGAPGGLDGAFESWKGNCCINWVDGIPYTAKWRTGVKDGQSWDFYEGHVRAEPVGDDPRMSPVESVRFSHRAFQLYVAKVFEDTPERRDDPVFMEHVEKTEAMYRDRLEAAKRKEAEGASR